MRGDYEAALVALMAWLRLSAMRQLTWNKNYNVKPREISAAQVDARGLGVEGSCSGWRRGMGGQI
jgi:hypothetical protein